MDSHVASYAGLFEGDTPVAKVEIPLIQRDYAQGRPGERIARIRSRFLTDLHAALTGGGHLDLDFVYGDVVADVFRPLDGQQRLTTLFLLHWYVGSRTDNLSGAAWTALSYATRPSARRFCEKLAGNPLPATAGTPRGWLTDQPWYLHPWRYDATVQGMLVMLDAIHDQFGDEDLDSVWEQLVDPDAPAVTFHVLPIHDMGAPDTLYIRMNARGRPLTDFETFKAQLLGLLDHTDRAWEVAQRLDGGWADVMWRLRDEDDLIDDAYLRYLRFIMQLCEWRRGDVDSEGRADIDRADSLFGGDAHDVDDNLDVLFQSFDVWLDGGEPVDTATVFQGLITADEDGTAALPVFGDLATNPNLLEACCRDDSFGGRRALMLHAIMHHRLRNSPDISRRLRLVRNLVEASANEIRPKAMPALIADIDRIIEDGDLDGVAAFNEAQRVDELFKRNLVATAPALEPAVRALEDHDLLRGCLMAFDLDPGVLDAHSRAFDLLFTAGVPLIDVTGALLALGDYSRWMGETKARFGPPHMNRRWRELLAGASPTREGMTELRQVLAQLLTRISASADSVADVLNAIQDAFITQKEADQRLDWRYYLVRYPSMRTGASGIYAFDPEAHGYSLCMLEGQALHGHYRDAYLHAVALTADSLDRVEGSVSKGATNGPWFTGYVAAPRWMRLRASGARMRCRADGFELQGPEDLAMAPVFDELSSGHGVADVDGKLIRRVVQHEYEGGLVDAEDRIQIGSGLLRDLVRAGL